MATQSVSDLTIGKYLKIVSKGAVYNNLSEDSEIWNQIKQKSVGPAEGRELRQLLRSAYGAAAAGFLPTNGGSYPTGHQSTVNESVAVYKDYAVTVEVERTVIAKAISDMSRYGEPLAEELRAKTITLSRLLSYRAYGDGTGVIAQRGADADVIASGRVVVSLDSTSSARGFVGWCQFGDRLVSYTEAGVEVTPTVGAGTFAYWEVIDRDRDNETVTLAAKDASDAELTVTVTNLSDSDVFYRNQQKSNGNITDLTAIGGSDYNTLSESWTGIESLSANDGRLVNGINMTGGLAGTRKDLGGQAIDSQNFQEIMSRLMINVGQGRYKYTSPLMAWETLDALVDSHETDRRFQSVKDNKSGVDQLGYVHGKNILVFAADEFCPKQRVYIAPQGDVMQFHGRDFEFANPDGSGQKFFLKPNGSGHDRTIRAYMEGQGALSSVHSAGIGVLENFTI